MARYFLFADVLGFTKLVGNLPHDSLDDRLDHWIKVIGLIRQGTEVTQVNTVSDSIIAMTEDSEVGLDRLMQFARLLLEQGTRNSFPIRGAITRGDLTWGESIYGRAVIEAIQLEKSQDWIGIACQSGLDVDWSWESACVYPVPKKVGEIQLMPAVIWDIPEPEELFRYCFGKDLVRKGEHIRWEVYSKLTNTLKFASYIRNSKKNSTHPKTFNAPIWLF